MLLKASQRTFALHTAQRACFSASYKSILIETDELDRMLGDPSLTVFNASYVTGAAPNPKAAHIQSRIPGSLFFDFNRFSNYDSPYSYTVPTEDQFQAEMHSLKVKRTDQIVVYDKIGMVSAPRAYWLFKLYGLPNVRILNGSFHKWAELEKRRVEEGERDSAFRRVDRDNEEFDCRYEYDHSKIFMFEQINKTSKQIVDTRVESVYANGTIPKAINIPFTKVLNDDKTYKRPEQIQEVLEMNGIKNPQINEDVVLSCQRGITASVMEIAMRLIGNEKVMLYDGSYEEYSKRIIKQ
ncbi:hypothetical protein FGO68_gene10564 [Halteria grandinella]|uniref:Rhodanese domain-containing protein n=1 Tax=Halteria grandinella TaxID=5974 RepID=A0A8J8SZN6_HALGN|nr:hypothetical protein FGO68_gene10564 [Halteria grandinella]